MDIFDFLDKFNWQTIIGMFAMGWYFTKDFRDEMKNINNSINKLDNDIRQQGQKLDNDVTQQGQRIDKLYEMFIDLLKEVKK